MGSILQEKTYVKYCKFAAITYVISAILAIAPIYMILDFAYQP